MIRDLKAGFAETVITPPDAECLLVGYALTPARGIHDALFASGVYLEDGKMRSVLLNYDLLAKELGTISGHQHFAHWQPFKYGFQWTLPALVEYPCAARMVVVDETNVRGHLFTPDEQLATHSIAPLEQRWTAGTDSDRAFTVLR